MEDGHLVEPVAVDVAHRCGDAVVLHVPLADVRCLRVEEVPFRFARAVIRQPQELQAVVVIRAEAAPLDLGVVEADLRVPVAVHVADGHPVAVRRLLGRQPSDDVASGGVLDPRSGPDLDASRSAAGVVEGLAVDEEERDLRVLVVVFSVRIGDVVHQPVGVPVPVPVPGDHVVRHVPVERGRVDVGAVRVELVLEIRPLDARDLDAADAAHGPGRFRASGQLQPEIGLVAVVVMLGQVRRADDPRGDLLEGRLPHEVAGDRPGLRDDAERLRLGEDTAVVVAGDAEIRFRARHDVRAVILREVRLEVRRLAAVGLEAVIGVHERDDRPVLRDDDVLVPRSERFDVVLGRDRRNRSRHTETGRDDGRHRECSDGSPADSFVSAAFLRFVHRIPSCV